MQKINGWTFLATIPAFLAAVIAPTGIVACYTFIVYSSTSGLDNGLSLSLYSFIVAFIVASAHLIVLGIPAFLLGLRWQTLSWWTCMIVAFTIGVSPFAIVNWSTRVQNVQLSSYLVFGLSGASGGLAFWLVWRYWVLPQVSFVSSGNPTNVVDP